MAIDLNIPTANNHPLAEQKIFLNSRLVGHCPIFQLLVIWLFEWFPSLEFSSLSEQLIKAIGHFSKSKDRRLTLQASLGTTALLSPQQKNSNEHWGKTASVLKTVRSDVPCWNLRRIKHCLASFPLGRWLNTLQHTVSWQNSPVIASPPFSKPACEQIALFNKVYWMEHTMMPWFWDASHLYLLYWVFSSRLETEQTDH